MYVCLCKGLTESEVKEVVRLLAQSGAAAAEVLEEEALITIFGLEDGDACGQCAREIERFTALAMNEWANVRRAA